MLTHDIATPVAVPVPASLALVEEINHRVINEYSEAIAMLSVAAAHACQGTQDILLCVAGRLRDHAEAHRALLPPVTEARVNLADTIGAICLSYSRATLGDRRVRLILQSEDIWIPGELAWRVGLVVAELIRNASRHGLKGKQGLIVVRITRNGERICCVVSDSGRSTTGGNPGRGQRLIRSLVSDLGGAIRWSFTARGNFAAVHFPMSGPRRPAETTATGPLGRAAAAH